MKKIVENEKITLVYHEADKIVHHTIHHEISGEDFRSVLLKGSDIFEEEGATKWLSDDRANGPFNEEDTDWSINVWSKKVVAAGWKFWALVLPEDVIGKLTLQGIVDFYAEMGVTVQIFSDPDEAMRWLKSV